MTREAFNSIPDRCPEWNTKWTWQGGTPTHAVIAVKLKDGIDLTCSNPECRTDFFVDKKYL